MRAKYMTDATAAEQKPHGTENRFERVDVDQHRYNHCPANEDGNAVLQGRNAGSTTNDRAKRFPAQ